MKLTDSQEKAIEHGGLNLQLIACAGSGKTEVVARRVVHLLTPGREDSLAPRNIVAFTFTDKAAAELKERIVTRTREALGVLPGLAEMFVGTIHAFCLELLKSEAPKYLKYEVLNEVQQGLFVDRNSKQSGLTSSTDLTGSALKRYRDTNHYIGALAILREAELEDANLNGCSIVDGLAAYQQLLNERSYLDYSSILEAAVEVLTNDDGLRGRLAERIKYVIVDEYQDVNPVQEAIAWSLYELGARICVVGDDDQTIYQWRGSDVENILTFDKRYPGVDQIPLEENFRSSDGIVETARAFIEQNASRLAKAMKPTGAQAHEPGDIVALSFATPDEEAQYITATAQSLRGVAFRQDDVERGLSWSDMAVLLRSVKSNAEPITAALQAAGIPFVVTGMTNLFGTAEAEAARQLFYLIGDHHGVDEAAVENAWNGANLGLDPAALQSAIQGAAAAKFALTDPDQKRWGQYSIQRVFLKFLDDAGVREERVPGGRGEVVFYNLGKFSQLISDYETIHYHSSPAEKYASFADFLQYRAEDAYPEGWQDNQYASPDAVRIMTIHQAKGMQWPVVFVPALLRNRFPAAGVGGRGVWHLLPRNGVKGQTRFEGYVVREPGIGEAAKLENYIEVICRLYRKDSAIQGATGFVHALAETEKEKIAISVGPLSGRVTGKQINDAVQDALASGILEVHVLGWAFEANVGEVKSQLERRGKVKVELIMIRPDTLAEGLKATQPEMLFSPLALPDIVVAVEKNGKAERTVHVTLKGVALFDRKRRTTEYKAADSGYVSAWYLDEDYDGDCFVDCQMFYDFKKTPNIKAALRVEVDPDEFTLKLASEPFPVRGHKRIAVTCGTW